MNGIKMDGAQMGQLKNVGPEKETESIRKPFLGSQVQES
jgi:hypothetical protein